MKPFKIETQSGKISAIFDNRYKEDIDILTPKFSFGNCVYTCRDEDINKLPKPRYEAHGQHICVMDIYEQNGDTVRLKNDGLNTYCEVSVNEDCLKIKAGYRNSIFSKFAFSLGLNYLSHKNGEWQNQFLVSSPYYDRENGRLLCLFTRPDGNHLMLVVKSKVSAFSIVYSYIVHFFDGFEIIANNDKAYGDTPQDSAEIEAYLYPVSSYDEGLNKANELLGIPYATYQKSDAVIGKPFYASVFGKCDKIVITSPDGKENEVAVSNNLELIFDKYGFYKITPYYKGKAGISCTAFSRYEWAEMYRRSVEGVSVDKDNVYGHLKDGTPVFIPPHVDYRGYNDSNLCEHNMWAWAQLKYMRNFPVSENAALNVKNTLNIVMADNESAYKDRHTVIPTSQALPNGEVVGPYNTYNISRIQEPFNGANIMLDAYRVYGDKKYLEFAVAIVENLLKDNLNEDNLIIRTGKEDYTTVTALIFPIADLAVFLKEIGDIRAAQFAKWAEDIGDALVRRGLFFPTESTKSDDYNEEVEEGSMACSALSVLYVARRVKFKQEYIDFANAVMKNHDAFSVFVYHPCMRISSLRWWEVLWEGDALGPALCCGHGWTVWQAEAEYWLGIMDKNSERLLKSYNGYNTNFSEMDEDGRMYAIWQCEPIIAVAGGGEYIKGEVGNVGNDIRRNAVGFPKTVDNTLSRYVYARGYDTWLRTSAVLESTVLNCQSNNGCLALEAPFAELLYIDKAGEYALNTEKPIELVTPREYAVVIGSETEYTEYSTRLIPENGVIKISVK